MFEVVVQVEGGEPDPYDDGVAWRLSVEMPLGGYEPLRERLVPVTQVTLERRPPHALRRAVREVLDESGEELMDWIRTRLELMGAAAAIQIAHLEDAKADLTRRGTKSSIARLVVERLGERLAFDSDLHLDRVDELECLLSEDPTAVDEVVLLAAVGAGRRLDVPSAEIVGAMTRGMGRPLGDRPWPDGRVLPRAAQALATDDRREAARAWAAEFSADMELRAPLLAAAVAEAGERSNALHAEEDPLWLGTARGAIFQHEAWRLDGPHSNDLHAVVGPF